MESIRRMPLDVSRLQNELDAKTLQRDHYKSLVEKYEGLANENQTSRTVYRAIAREWENFARTLQIDITRLENQIRGVQGK